MSHRHRAGLAACPDWSAGAREGGSELGTGTGIAAIAVRVIGDDFSRNGLCKWPGHAAAS